MAIEIVGLEESHIKKMDIRSMDGRFLNAVGIDQYIKNIMISGFPSYTLLVDDHPIVVGGVLILWPGVGEVWTITDNQVERYPKTFHKGIKYVLNEFTDFYSLHRLQATCLTIHEKSQKWIERLGFVKEGVMKQYDMDKQDYLMFARLT